MKLNIKRWSGLLGGTPHSKRVAVAAIVMLAIGIGPSVAVFSVVKAAMFRPLPYPDADRIVWIWGTSRIGEATRVSLPDFFDIQTSTSVFETCAAFNAVHPVFVDESQTLSGLLVSADFFEVLGVRPLLGRTFADEDEDDWVGPVVLSHGLWKGHFGGDPDIVGKTIDMAWRGSTVIGVMPEGFGVLPSPDSSHHQYDIWRLVSPGQRKMLVRDYRFFHVIARLRPGATMAQAQAEVENIARELELSHPRSNRGIGFRIDTLARVMLGDVDGVLQFLFGAVAAVLLIATANVSNLLLARATDREGEVAVRTALGAGRWHVFRLFFGEAITIGLVAGLVGFVLGSWSVDVLVALSPDGIGRLSGIGVDGGVVVFALVVSFLSSLVVAAVPTLRAVHVEPHEFLQRGALRGRSGKSHGKLEYLLVVMEVALAVILMTSSLTMSKGLEKLLAIDTGFDHEGVLVARVDSFSKEIEDRLGRLQGVWAVGAVSLAPIVSARADMYVFGFTEEDDSNEDDNGGRYAFMRTATPGYFATMGIPLLKGSLFEGVDGLVGVVINHSMGERVWPGEDPIGKTITTEIGESMVARVVGVVGDVRQVSLDREPWYDLYDPWTSKQSWMYVVVRADPEARPAVNALLGEAMSDGRPPEVRILTEAVHETVATRRFIVWLVSAFTWLATLLALLGVYASLSYWVSTQVTVLAVRSALGAPSRNLIGLVLRKCLRLVIVGVILGLAASVALGRVLGSIFPGMNLNDPLAFTAALLGFAVMVVAAAIWPAIRAAETDPLVVLRHG